MVRSALTARKAQAWYLDLVLGIAIFVIMLIISLRYVAIETSTQIDERQNVFQQAQTLSDSLMTSGIPYNWTEDDVISIGLVDPGDSLNVTKLNSLRDLSYDNFDFVRTNLGLKSDFLVYFEEINGTLVSLTPDDYIGTPGTTLAEVDAEEPDEEVFLQRYVVYREGGFARLLSMNVVVWS